jgi:uncharacterized protein
MDLSLAFTFGLIGSLHCIQMCGPLVVACSMPLGHQPRTTQLLGQVAYNAGRMLTYGALGVVAGAAGGIVHVAGRLAGIEQAAALIGGVALLVAAAVMVGFGTPGGGRTAPITIRRVFRPASVLSKTVATLVGSPSPLAKGAMGLMLGLLPCGLVYAALVQAAATSTAWGGAATMLAFGAGTSGALFAIGACSTSIGRWAGRWSTQAAGAAVAVMGIVLLWRAAMATHAVHLARHGAGI